PSSQARQATALRPNRVPRGRTPMPPVCLPVAIRVEFVLMTITEDVLERVRDVVAPEAWSTQEATRTAMAHDASHYLLTPKAVFTPRNLGELTAGLVRAHRSGVPVTFRAGGTSLSGQG